MMISTRGRYALRMLTELAESGGEGYLTLKELAGRQEISEKYLESIAKDLVRAGILEGLRGKGGGYRLGREPEQIPVLEVLTLTEGTLAPVGCLAKGSGSCARAPLCRTLPLWEGLERVVKDYLRGYSVADLMRREPDGYDYVI